MTDLSVTRIIQKVLEIAKENNDNGLKKWACLELEGYYASNKYLKEDVVVPEYREVPGEYRDAYGRPLLIEDPELGFVNTTRLRNSVAELETILDTAKRNLIIRDPHAFQIIKEHLGVIVTEFIINPASIAGVLNSVREEATRRSEKYVSRRELMSEGTQKNNERVYGTLSWLWANLPITVWFKLFGILIFFFSLGLYVSGITPIRNILGQIPFYKSNLMLTPETSDVVKKGISDLIAQHKIALSELQKQLLDEERLSSNHMLVYTQRDIHKEGSLRIQELIKKENDNFYSKMKALRAMLE